jgi:uncharacterized protein YecE (DUF72 family)
MAVKVSQFLTHRKRLREPRESVARFVDRTAGLGAKLGPVLLQLPPQFRRDDDRLAAALAEFPPSYRVAVEFRHDSWFAADIRALLEDCQAALCLADRRGPRTPIWRTTGWTYLRFHEGRATPRPCYGRTALATWAERLAGLWPPSADAWVYFNNDPLGCAPRDAVRFAAAVRRAGLVPTRVPRLSEAPAG